MTDLTVTKKKKVHSSILKVIWRHFCSWSNQLFNSDMLLDTHLRVISDTGHLSPFLKALVMVSSWELLLIQVTWPWYIPRTSPQSMDTMQPTNADDMVNLQIEIKLQHLSFWSANFTYCLMLLSPETRQTKFLMIKSLNTLSDRYKKKFKCQLLILQKHINHCLNIS